MVRYISLGMLVTLLLSASAQSDDVALELFKSKITPIFNSPNPSSCTECHLSGVELKDYIGDTQEETFASLKKAGLIDVKNPDNSKLLTFIKRTPEKSTPVGAKARKLEYEAFRAWISAAVKDPKLLAATEVKDQFGPKVPVEVIRHSRQDRILRSFNENIWAEIGRCVSCHSPEMNRKKIGRNGKTKADIDAISWVTPRDPAGTLQNLIDSGNIDTDSPADSPVLTKPVGIEEHGGGSKFALGSRTDKNYRRFLKDYAAIVNGEYKEKKQLPKESKQVALITGQFLKITNLPNDFDKNLLRADLYRKTGQTWSKEPWATAENAINGKAGQWMSPILAVAERGTSRAETLVEKKPLASGVYLLKIYIDQSDKVKNDRDYILSKEELYRQIEISGQWSSGWQKPKIVRVPSK